MNFARAYWRRAAWRMDVKKLCLVSIAIAGITLFVPAQANAQGRGGGGQGGVGQISVGGKPTVPDPQAAGPVPLHDQAACERGVALSMSRPKGPASPAWQLRVSVAPCEPVSDAAL